MYLDIEVVGAMAPGATQDVYFAPWTGAGYLNAIDEAVQADDYAAVSISYGLDEDMAGDAQDPAWPMLNQNVDEAFRDATAIGLPVFVSSGDQGSSSGRGSVKNQEVTLYEPQCHVEYPSSSPYATAVGGTMLYSESGQITNEIVWNELGQLVQKKYYYGGCTGGGVSDRYTTVPSYQTKAGVQIASANDPTKTGRAVPDVSGNSGSTTGYLVTQPPGGEYPIAPVGGTSAAAPMWAALMACVRESLTTTFQGKIPIFFINDFIYANGTSAAFRDIVAGRTLTYTQTGIQYGPITEPGNNQSSATNGYTAQKGYDCCTGWGSPNGQELLILLTEWLKTQPTGSSSP